MLIRIMRRLIKLAIKREYPNRIPVKRIGEYLELAEKAAHVAIPFATMYLCEDLSTSLVALKANVQSDIGSS
jgi:hypothetical protein